MSFRNLTKLANAVNPKAEQEKKPSKATYIPAVAGLAAGGSLALSGQKGVSEAQTRLKDVGKELAEATLNKETRQAELQRLLDGFQRRIDEGDLSYHDLLYTDRLPESRDYKNAKTMFSEAEHGENVVRNTQKLFKKKLSDAKTLRTKQMAGGLGLLGLGVGTTALLRRRKKRKQQMAQQQAQGIPKAASASRKTLEQLMQDNPSFEHDYELGEIADAYGSNKERVDAYEDYLKLVGGKKDKSVAKAALKGGLIGGGLMTGAGLLTGASGKASAIGGSAVGVPLGALMAGSLARSGNKSREVHRQLLATPRQEKEKMMRKVYLNRQGK